MKKTAINNGIIKAVIVAFIATLLLTATFLSVDATGNTVGGAAIAPGGTVNNATELITALGGENNATLSSDGSTVYLSRDIILNTPIFLVSGTYRIVGRGCTVYRGFDDGALFHLAASSLADSEGKPLSLPVLTLGAETKLENQDLSEPDLILDGNCNGFTEAVNGPLIALLGKCEVTINPSTKLTGNRSSAPGGAIYLESFSIGNEVTPLEPTLYINGGEISGNSSTVAGGAIAAYGRLKGTPSGNVQINGCKIEGNTVVTADSTEIGKGGAIFTDGMRLTLSGCEINSNCADEGGALYVTHDTVISNCTLTKNRANKNGGAIYIDLFTNKLEQTSEPASVSVISCYVTENHSDGTGGVLVNRGNLTFPAETSSYVCNNTAKGNGAIIFNEGKLELNCGELFYNTTTEGRGGIYNLGTVDFNGADMRINSATIGGAIYNLGTLNFKKGCFSGNKCSVKNAPHIANLGKMTMSGSFVIDEDVLGLFPITNENGDTQYTNIEITNKITTNVKISIAVYKAITEEITPDSLSYGTKNVNYVFSGLNIHKETAATRSVIVENGIGSYRINTDGTISYVFPVMPLGAWIGCVLGLAAISVGTVFFIKKRKKSETDEPEPEN